jgi:hypothetical protein
LIFVALEVRFDPIEYNVPEGDQVSLTVRLNSPADREVTVDVSTTDGTASGRLHCYHTSIVCVWGLGKATTSHKMLLASKGYMFEEISKCGE